MQNQARRDLITEITKIVHTCEERMIDLEKTIKSTQNQGVKALMQQSYVLNKSLYMYYKDYYKRLIS